MKKEKDFTTKVMAKVATKQRSRLVFFFALILAALAMSGFVLVIFGLNFWQTVQDGGLADFFTAVANDWSLFNQSWGEVSILLWSELDKIFLTVALLGVILLILIGKKRQKIKNSLESFKETKKYLR